MGPAQADRALDDPDLALCVGYRSSRLLNPLPLVPAASALKDEPADRSDAKILRSTAI